MDVDELIGLAHDIGTRMQEIQVHTIYGRHEEARSAFDKLSPFILKCLKERITFCIMVRRISSMPDNQPFSVTIPVHHNWPPCENHDGAADEEPSAHVHLTLTYRITHHGQVEIQPDGIEAEITYLQEKQDNDTNREESAGPHGEGRILSSEETRDFFKKYGLGDLEK